MLERLDATVGGEMEAHTAPYSKPISTNWDLINREDPQAQNCYPALEMFVAASHEAKAIMLPTVGQVH